MTMTNDMTSVRPPANFSPPAREPSSAVAYPAPRVAYEESGSVPLPDDARYIPMPQPERFYTMPHTTPHTASQRGSVASPSSANQLVAPDQAMQVQQSAPRPYQQAAPAYHMPQLMQPQLQSQSYQPQSQQQSLAQVQLQPQPYAQSQPQSQPQSQSPPASTSQELVRSGSRARSRHRDPTVRPGRGALSSFAAAGGGAGNGVIMFLSSSGGVGSTVLTALCAWHLTMRNRTCALVDADFTAGGMDVTLGIETEPGMRWSSVSAPLGRIEPRSLMHELPEWEETVVLAADPWNDGAPDWWEVDAAMRALSEACELVLVDGGHADSEHTLRMQARVRVVVVELSVLGLARARGLLMRLKESQGGGGRHGGGRHGGGGGSGGARGGSAGARQGARSRSGGRHGGPGGIVSLASTTTLLVGIKPAAAPRSGVVTLDEAEGYLGSPLVAIFTHDRSISRSVLSGTGIPAVPRRYRRSLNTLCDRLEMECRNE
ncbi:hypothetical protein [Bifidobacterium tissieri]|nr:hypothetical protein [Bifidobacterium tissieri]